MVHKEFVQKYKSRQISVSIDQSKSFELVNAGLLGKPYYISQIFYSWIWVLGIIGGILLLIFYKWWVGLLIMIISIGLPGAIRKTAAQGIRDKLLEDPEFYEIAKENSLFFINDI